MIESIYGRDYPVIQGLTTGAGAAGLAHLPCSPISCRRRSIRGRPGDGRRDHRRTVRSRRLAVAADACRRSSHSRHERIRCRSRRSSSRPTTRSPSTMALFLQAPSWAHPFGTDNFGRDMLSRTIWAYSIDMQIAVFATIAPFVVGTLVGAFVGYRGGIVEALFGRIVDADHHLPVPRARDRHRRGPRARAQEHVHRRRRGRLGLLRPPDRGGDEGAEAARLRRGRPRHGLQPRPHHPPPSPAERHHAGDRLLDDRHGAGHPARLEPRLSRASAPNRPPRNGAC